MKKYLPVTKDVKTPKMLLIREKEDSDGVSEDVCNEACWSIRSSTTFTYGRKRPDRP